VSSNIIDRALVRNNDFLRKRQQASIAGAQEEDTPIEERTLGQLAVQAVPSDTTKDFFADNSPDHAMLRAYLAQNLQLPSTSQLQHYAKNAGAPMSYTKAGPLIKQCRSWLLDGAVTSEVLVVDAFGMSCEGVLQAWREAGEHWSVELCDEAGSRLQCKSDKEPAIFLSEPWVRWLTRSKSGCGGA